MLQTAQVSPEEQFLKIVDRETSSDITLTKNFQDVNFAILRNDLFKEVTPFHYKTKVHLSFSVAEEFQPEFIMIKGLIEFHRSKEFSFNYNLQQRTIETDVNASQLNKLQIFLANVFVWLKKEKQFKRSLKVALEFEKRYKLEREAIYSTLKNAIAIQ